jgi:hypothetical protein
MPAASTTASVRSKPASVSVGNPTIASVVTLKSSRGWRRCRNVATE